MEPGARCMAGGSEKLRQEERSQGTLRITTLPGPRPCCKRAQQNPWELPWARGCKRWETRSLVLPCLPAALEAKGSLGRAGTAPAGTPCPLGGTLPGCTAPGATGIWGGKEQELWGAQPAPPGIQPRLTKGPVGALQCHCHRGPCRSPRQSCASAGSAPSPREAAHLPRCQGCCVATGNKPLSCVPAAASSRDQGQRKEMSRQCRQMMGAGIWDGEGLLIRAKAPSPVCARGSSLQGDPQQAPLWLWVRSCGAPH